MGRSWWLRRQAGATNPPSAVGTRLLRVGPPARIAPLGARVSFSPRSGFHRLAGQGGAPSARHRPVRPAGTCRGCARPRVRRSGLRGPRRRATRTAPRDGGRRRPTVGPFRFDGLVAGAGLAAQDETVSSVQPRGGGRRTWPCGGTRGAAAACGRRDRCEPRHGSASRPSISAESRNCVIPCRRLDERERPRASAPRSAGSPYRASEGV